MKAIGTNEKARFDMKSIGTKEKAMALIEKGIGNNEKALVECAKHRNKQKKHWLECKKHRNQRKANGVIEKHMETDENALALLANTSTGTNEKVLVSL